MKATAKISRPAKPPREPFHQALDDYFARFPTIENIRAKCHGNLMKLWSTGIDITGKPEAWLAGLIYTVMNDGKFPRGVEGMRFADFAEIWGVSTNVIRARSWAIKRVLGWTYL